MDGYPHLILAAILGFSCGCSADRWSHGTKLSIDGDTPVPALSLKPAPRHRELAWTIAPEANAAALEQPGADGAIAPQSRFATSPLDLRQFLSPGAVGVAMLDDRDTHAHPCDTCAPLTFRSSMHEFGPGLKRDLRSLAKWETAGILTVGGAASLAVRETADDDVRDWSAESLHRWGAASDVLAAAGNPAHHFATAGVLWGVSLATQNQGLYDASGAMINALILTNASTLLLKLAANTNPPNGESHGWPSGHTASSFTMAALLDEFYGPWIGLPAYGVAGAVAFSRIDDREHDLSDVVFGAALGYAIGKVVAANHHRDWEGSGITLLPYLDPVEGTTGIALEKRF